MPELPEVANVAKQLKKALINKKIISGKVFLIKIIKNVSAEEFLKSITNATILDVFNIAKHIVFILDNDLVIIFHLRMEGKFKIYSSKKEIQKHDYVVFELDDKKIVAFYDHRQFATIHLCNLNDYLEVPPLKNVGPTPFDIGYEHLYKKLQKKTIAIKSALLDQQLISGIGNIYVNEILWDVKINPSRPSNQIDINEVESILKSSRRILAKSIEMGGSTISSFTILNETEGGYQDLLIVHMRKGEQCPRCNHIIEKKVVGGRGTYYCPNCQKH